MSVTGNITKGSNVRLLVSDKNCSIMQVRDESGEGTLTLYPLADGIFLCFSDMHMTGCKSEFELKDNEKVFCIDHCREGRIEHEVMNGVFSILQEGHARLDNRKHHSGYAYMPLKHFHGLSIYLELPNAQQSLDEAFPIVSADISSIRSKFCKSETPYILKNDPQFERIISGMYDSPVGAGREYYMLKVVEILYLLNSVKAVSPDNTNYYIHKSLRDKIRMVYDQITEDLKHSYTIEELSAEFDVSATALKKGFKEMYGDSIYSFLKRFRINSAASMLMTNPELSIADVAQMVGYRTTSKFSVAFKKIIGVTPLVYRNNGGHTEEIHFN